MVVVTPGNTSEAALEGHLVASRSLAAESIVLLKNEKGALPLSRPASGGKVAIIGLTARHPVVGGGGSGSVVAAYAFSLLHQKQPLILLDFLTDET